MKKSLIILLLSGCLIVGTIIAIPLVTSFSDNSIKTTTHQSTIRNALAFKQSPSQLAKGNPSYDEMLDKYEKEFSQLQQHTEERLSELFAIAYQEWAGAELSLTELYEKYEPIIESQEHELDKAFTSLFETLEQDLKAQGYSELAARSIIDHFEQTKEKEHKEFLAKLYTNISQ